MATVLDVGAGKTYETINAAVTAAKSIEGKVEIVIFEGNYTENVSFGSRTFVEDGKTYVGGITFRAAAGAEVNINGYFQCNATAGDIKDVVFDSLNISNYVRNGGYFTPIMFGDNYSGKTASGITVTGCVLNSTVGAGSGTASGVALTMGLVCDGITVSNNTINADCGVYGGDGNLIANTVITGNTMNGNEAEPSYNYWGVVYIYNSGAGNVISDNTISNSALYAVKVNKGNGIVFTGNDITDCGAVRLVNGSAVADNTVDGEALVFPAYEGNALLFFDDVAGQTGDTVVFDGIAYTVGTNIFATLDGQEGKVASAEELVFVGGNEASYYTHGWGENAYLGRFYLDHNVTISTVGDKYALFGFDGQGGGAGIYCVGNGTDTPVQIVFDEDSKIKSGDLVVQAGAEVVIKGAFTMGVYDAENRGNMRKGVFNFNGKVTIDEGSDFQLNGAMLNNGTLIVKEDFTINQTQGAGSSSLGASRAAVTEITGATLTYNGFNDDGAVDNRFYIGGQYKSSTDTESGYASSVTMTDGAKLVVNNAQFIIGTNGSLNLAGSSVEVEKTFTLNGTLAMDAASSLIGEGSIVLGENAVINIDVEGFSGSRKFIDLAGTESLKGKVNFINMTDNISAIYGADGDVTITDADLSVLYVDASYTADNVGEGKVFGINAFASFAEALTGIIEKTEKIEITGDITEDIPAAVMEIALAKDLLISGAGEAASKITLNNGGYKALVFGPAEGAEDIAVKFANVELVAPKSQLIFGNSAYADDGSIVYFPVKVVIDSNSVVSGYVTAVEYDSYLEVQEGGKFFSTGEVMNIKGTMTANGNEAFDAASETLTAEDRQIVAHYMWDYGTVNLNDTYATIYSQLRLRGSNSSFTADNSLVELGKKVDGTWLGNPSANGVGWANIDGTMNLVNNSVLKASGATGKGGYGMTVNAGAALNIESGSTAEFSAGVKNDGTINVEDGTLKVGTEFTAPGTQPPATDLAGEGVVNVSGTSTLEVENFTGGKINVADGTTLKDTVIAGKGTVSFAKDGVISFEGKNEINATLANNSGYDLVINKNAELTITRDLFVWGYNRNITVNGVIEDATMLETLDGVQCSLQAVNADGGFSIGGTGTHELVVNDAYVNLGKSSWKNAKGTYTWNFNNSYLQVVNFADTKAGASDTASWVTTFDDSVLAASSHFKSGKGMTINFTNGSVGIAKGSMRMDGVLNIDETSSVEVQGYFNAGAAGAASEHSDILGTLNIAGSMNIKGSGATNVELIGGEININGGNLNLTNNNGTVNNIVMDAESAMNVAGSLTAGKITNAGEVIVKANADFNADSITGDGALILDAEGFTSGTNKVIDLNAAESLKGKLEVTGLEEGISVAYGKDGDVLVTDADVATLHVSSDYTGKEFGDVLEDGKVVGANAFDSVTDAVSAQTEKTTGIKIESDITEAMSGSYTGNWVADKAVTVTDSDDSLFYLTDSTIGENITLTGKDIRLSGSNTFDGKIVSSTTFYNNGGKNIINGTAEVSNTFNRYNETTETGIFVVGTAAAGEGKNADVQYKAKGYLGHYSGTFSVKDTAAEFGYILLNGDTDGDGYSKATLVADNASIKTVGGPNTQPGQVQMNGDSSIVATNGSVLDFRGPKDFGYISMGADNSISLTDSEMYLGKEGQGGNTLAGTITLKNSTLDSLGKLNSTAAITIDGTSFIRATAITGAGTITIDLKGYTGEGGKIIDVDNGIDNTVKVTNTGNNYYLSYGDDGDVYVNVSPEFVYVSSDYNSSTEGWGVTKFANYDSAVAFVKDNARKATIVMEKTTTISGNCVKDKTEDLKVDLTNTLVIKDGAVMGNAQSKWDMTYAVTIEAGGILQSARGTGDSIGNTHIKNKLVIGEAGSDKQAKILFINGKSGITYQTMSIALLAHINRSITANNALIEVGDMGLLANASFTDTTLTIEGILAIKGSGLYKTTMTDTTVTIKGHNLMNENTYYSTVGTILGNLTMDNTSIEVDDKVDTTVAEKVWLGYTGNAAQTLTMTNGSSITIEEGTEVEVANKVVMTDSEINVGTLNAGTVKPANSSFYFNQLEKGKVYYAVIYDADGNELETIVRTSTSGSTFYPKFSTLPAGDYTVKCFKDEAKTELHQEKTYSFVAIGSMDLTNSDINADKIVLAGNNLVMDYQSTLAFTEISGGTITVKADGYKSGNYKMFDYVGDGEMTEADYKALLNNLWNEDYLVFNNDLYMTDQDLATIYVNTAWSADEVGSTVGNGYIYGYNAVSNFADVAEKIATDGSDTTIKLESDAEVKGDVVFQYGTGDITFTADSAVTVKQAASSCGFYFVTGQDGEERTTITIGENVTFQLSDNNSDFAVWYGANLKVDGTITGGANWGALYAFNGAHTVSATGTVSTGRVQVGVGSLTVDGKAGSDRTEAHINTNYLLIEASDFTANNAIINSGAVHDTNNGGARYGASVFKFNNSALTANSVTLKYADSVFNVEGGSAKVGTFANAGKAAFTKAEATITAMDNDGQLKINGSSVAFGSFDNSGYVDVTAAKAFAESAVNSGTIKANNASILFNEFDNAAGSVDVTGGSYLEIGKLTGEINAENAKLTGSITGGTLNVYGESDVKLTAVSNKVVFGSVSKTVNATVDVSGWKIVDFAAQNGTVNIIGKTDGDGLYPMKVGGFYKDAAGVLPEEGEAAMGSTTVNITKDAYVKANQVYIADNSALKEHTLNVDGALETNSIWNKALGNLNVTGKVSANYLQAAGDVTVSGENAKMVLTENNPSNGATKIGTDAEGLRSQFKVENGATVSAVGNVYVGYSENRHGDLVIDSANFQADKVTVQSGSTVSVTGDSSLNIGKLTGSINVDSANLTDSVINKGSVNFKGVNTFEGDFNASYAFVGDWDNKSYDGSVDFGTESSVNVGGQMIIGCDTKVAGASNVVFGDVTGAVITDKVFKAADVSVRRDGTLTIANTTGANKINTMNVMGSVVIDNAQLSGEVQIGNNSADIDAVMTVKNGAVVNLGGSSNSIVILGKSNGGILNIDNATVNVQRCGSGASYVVPADFFVIGYNGGVGVLNMTNGATFTTGSGSKYATGVLISSGSSVNMSGESQMTIAGDLVNNGSLNMTGYDTLTVNGVLSVGGIITIDLSQFSGVDKKVVDLSGSFDWIEGTNVEFIGKDDDTIIYWGTEDNGNAGDITVTRVDKSTLLVDKDFADAEVYEEVEPGWVKDANAFAGTSEIIWSEKTEAIIIRDGAYDDFTVERDNVIDLATDAAEGSIVELNTNINTNVTVKDVYAVTGNINISEDAAAAVSGKLALDGDIVNAGDIFITDGADFSADEVENAGSIAISGNVTINTEITGDGSVAMANGTVLDGDLTAGTVTIGEEGAVLAGSANLNAVVTGGSLTVSGADNALKLQEGSESALIVDSSVVFDTEDLLDDVVIKGAEKDTVITVADGALAGNTIENVKLNITDLENDGLIRVFTDDIANILSVNTHELTHELGIHYYTVDGKLMYVAQDKEGLLVTDGVENHVTAEEIYKSFTVGEDFTTLAYVDVFMAGGKTTVSVKNGKKNKDGSIDKMTFAIGGILKDTELGGSNTLKFGNYNDVTVNGSIESLANMTLGKNSKLYIGGDVTAQNTNNTISIGADSVVVVEGDIVLAGGKNVVSVGARSNVTFGSVADVVDFKIAAGKKDNYTNVTITGKFTAPAMNNKLTVGNYASLTIGEVDGVSIDNGGVSSATGTTVKVGTASTMSVAGSANGIAAITTGKESDVSFVDIVGTDKNNKISVGANAAFSAGDINLASGKNTITTAAGAKTSFTAGAIKNVQTINVGGQSSFTAESITGVNKFTVNNGKAATKKAAAVLTNAAINGDVVMTEGKDTFKVGSNSNVIVDGNLVFGEGKDTLSVGKNSILQVEDITGLDVFNAVAGATVAVLNGKDNELDLNGVTGSWNKATLIDGEGELESFNEGMVYSNELDGYTFELEAGKSLTFENLSEGTVIKYTYNGEWSVVQDYTGELTQAGEYRIIVGVDSDNFTKKDEKLAYSFDVKLA